MKRYYGFIVCLMLVSTMLSTMAGAQILLEKQVVAHQNTIDEDIAQLELKVVNPLMSSKYLQIQIDNIGKLDATDIELTISYAHLRISEYGGFVFNHDQQLSPITIDTIPGEESIEVTSDPLFGFGTYQYGFELHYKYNGEKGIVEDGGGGTAYLWQLGSLLLNPFVFL